MDESIGKYIQKYLRYKGISNEAAGASVGLSESAFEKHLTKDDELIGVLLKLSSFTNKNFLEYYYDKEPLSTFRNKEISQWTEKIEGLEKTIQLQEELIKEKDQIMALQSKYIAELEEKLNQQK